MDEPTIASANNSQPLSSLSDANFSQSPFKPSGVPVPVYKQNGRRWKSWVIPLVFLLVATVGYVFWIYAAVAVIGTGFSARIMPPDKTSICKKRLFSAIFLITGLKP